MLINSMSIKIYLIINTNLYHYITLFYLKVYLSLCLLRNVGLLYLNMASS